MLVKDNEGRFFVIKSFKSSKDSNGTAIGKKIIYLETNNINIKTTTHKSEYIPDVSEDFEVYNFMGQR